MLEATKEMVLGLSTDDQLRLYKWMYEVLGCRIDKVPKEG